MADSTEAANQAAADNFKAGLKWLQTPEAAKLSAAAKAKTLSYFKQRYLNADMGAFEVQVTKNQPPAVFQRIHYKACLAQPYIGPKL